MTKTTAQNRQTAAKAANAYSHAFAALEKLVGDAILADTEIDVMVYADLTLSLDFLGEALEDLQAKAYGAEGAAEWKTEREDRDLIPLRRRYRTHKVSLRQRGLI